MMFQILCTSLVSLVVSLPAAQVMSYVVVPAPQTQEDQTYALYEQWKLHFLRQGVCNDNERYVNSFGEAGDRKGDITVSEAHAYGMRLLAAMAKRDPDAHGDFDRMVNLYLRSRISEAVPLMAWRVTAACEPAVNVNSAPDGDLDIAQAFLDAEQAWGNDGQHNYGALARAILRAEMDHVVQGANSDRPILGLWEDMDKSEVHYGGTRLSDYMFQSFAQFAEATGDKRWLKLEDNGYRLMSRLQKHSLSGLLPDFAIVQGSHVHPAPKDYLEGQLDGGYGYNACRVPWRLAKIYKQTGDARAHDLLLNFVTGIDEVSGHDPHALFDGYTLSGWQVGTRTDRLAFVAPAAIAFDALPEFAKQAPKWRAAAAVTTPETFGYYNESLRLMTLID